jgi:hypothetical protein
MINARIILALAQLPLAAATCESLSSLSVPHTTITLAQSLAAGEFILPTGAPGPNFKELPAFCRVSATSAPTSDSEIKIEVWMPMSGWNGKLRGTGNGGLGGNLSFGGLATAMHGGFAAAAENTGHENGSACASVPDSSDPVKSSMVQEPMGGPRALRIAMHLPPPKVMFQFQTLCPGTPAAPQTRLLSESDEYLLTLLLSL